MVADFVDLRIVRGGQGRHLLPSFTLLFQDHHDTGVVNIGGMSNMAGSVAASPLTSRLWLWAWQSLMDAWIRHHQRQAYDHQGQWAMTDQLDAKSIKRLLSHPFFQQKGPAAPAMKISVLTAAKPTQQQLPLKMSSEPCWS